MDTNKLLITDGFEKMDFEKVTRMLSRAKWSMGIGIEEVKQGASHSALVVGAFYAGEQVGYARVISDATRFAYLSDVYVDEAVRHHGIAQKMLAYIMEHDALRDVYQWLLRSEAHELYAKAGFAPITLPEKWMEIRSARPQR